MGTSALERMAASMGLLGAFIALVVVLVLAAFLLGLIFRIVAGYFPSIPRAIGVVLLTAVVAFAASIVGKLFVPPNLVDWVALGIALLAGAGWVNYQLLSSNGQRVGYHKALLVQLIFLGVCLLLWMAFAASTVAVSAVP